MNKKDRAQLHKEAYALLTDAVDRWAKQLDSDEEIEGSEAVDWLVCFVKQARFIVKP